MSDAPKSDPQSPSTKTTVKRREFHELHKKDQQTKQVKKLCIEQNWRCPIAECLPVEIRPRIEARKGSKARMGETDVPEESWWNWSVELLKTVEELSSILPNDVEYARQLLLIEVEHRQANPKSPQRKILELLLGDVQRVVEETKKRLADANEQDCMEDMNAANGDTSMVSQRSTYQSQLGSSEALQTRKPRTSALNGNGSPDRLSQADVMTVVDQITTTELKGRACRLRAEAIRLEAEALQLEIAARELREQM